ncbi:Protein MEMO1 [Tetrabaena socialis]|uniref:Protein MEMO1 n=1 Tax=Tetrabaena socialis TaxID=47790 RepID=A0A2J8ADW4_9CHLO|nr:Protein MEMO1 [Tetrabaena socialis]|eukprot:PNH10686.1 Protein MEMO1 [Tetrabaena socialis]
MPKIRRPSHASSWYQDDAGVLEAEIDEWKAAVEPQPGLPARAIIGPHAGYSYCGHVMAHAYVHIDPTKFKRVFLLGPSHHVFSRKCMLSSQEEYGTPLGSMRIDQEVYAELKATGQFDLMSRDVDEAEHSLELHSPYIFHTMRGQAAGYTLVPIMVGALTTQTEALFGKLLGPYLDDPTNLFVVSSDFCHWGSRFSYTYYNREQGQIWESIKWLDELGIQAIESGDPAQFAAYQEEYRNTICGRHPIGVFLNMLQHSQLRHEIRFTHYDQSSKCVAQNQSSVSYASAVVRVVEP